MARPEGPHPVAEAIRAFDALSARVTRVWADDWEGLYVNGRLKAEDHRVSLRDAFNAVVGLRVVSFNELEIESWWVEERGCFPIDLGDIPEEVRI